MRVVKIGITFLLVTLLCGFQATKAEATYPEYNSCIELEKTGPVTASPGEEVTYHFRVTNCGELPFLSGYYVYDILFGYDAIHSGELYPGEVHEFDMTYTVTEEDCGYLINKAWVDGFPIRPDGTADPTVVAKSTWIMFINCDDNASLGDFVWLDLNNNGIQEEGEEGIDGVVVNLYDCLDNFIKSTVTSSGGYYLFRDLVPGEYYVEFEKPAGYEFSPSGQGGDNTLDSDADPTTGKSACTTLAPGENDTSWDAGLYQPAALGNYVWEDLNKDGIQNDGDTGFPGVTVNLYDCNNNMIATTTTNADGMYLFDNLDPGCYVVQFEKPTGYEFSPLGSGSDDSVDSDAFPSGTTEQIILQSGDEDLTWDAGLISITTSEIGDFVWEDINANGIQDPGEPGIAGVTVSLYDCFDNLLATEITDASGFYLFSNLLSGDYYIVFERPFGYLPAPQDIGANDMDSDADINSGKTACISLGSNESNRTIDAGFYRTASIGDFVWQDLNSDGIQNINESGIEQITVNLYDCSDNFISSTNTGFDGKYLFENLTPGNYYLEFIIPQGSVISPQDAGADDIDSDVAVDTGKTICTTLDSGENDITWDAGLRPEQCNLNVTKSCYVPIPPPSDTFDCVKPVDSITMLWDGSQSIRIRAWKGSVGSTLLADIDNIINGDAVTVNGYAGSPNDVYWEIIEAGTNNIVGKSKFHLSCSDEEMNGVEDCGKYQGDGKSNESGLINNWILAGMTDSKSSFNCFPEESSDPVSTCEVTVPLQTECDNKIKSIVLRYVGGDCNETNNWQDGKFKCNGDAGINEPVQIVITKDADKITVIHDNEFISIGDRITLVADNEFGSETKFDIIQYGMVLQSLNIHTSCSQPFRLGDRFGSMEVVAMDVKDGDYLTLGSEVDYTYVIENTGSVAVENITVVDGVLGEIPGSPIALLQPGETATLEATEFIEEATTGFVEVNGVTVFGEECSAIASSTVNISVPQKECITSGNPLLRISTDETNKVEWEFYNNGSDTITIDSISLSWPEKLGKLRKIKLGGDTIFEPDEVDRPTPPFTSISNWKGNVDKRQIAGATKDKLTFEFEQKAFTNQFEHNISVNFLEGCTLNFVPGKVPFDCEKPINAITMIWAGGENIRIKAWKGNVGSILLNDIDNIVIGQEVTVSGYAGSPNDVSWEIFNAGTDIKIGESKFHLSCSDNEMNGQEDCGTNQGNGKSNESDLINDWLLEGMEGSISILDCTE